MLTSDHLPVSGVWLDSFISPPVEMDTSMCVASVALWSENVGDTHTVHFTA